MNALFLLPAAAVMVGRACWRITVTAMRTLFAPPPPDDEPTAPQLEHRRQCSGEALRDALRRLGKQREQDREQQAELDRLLTDWHYLFTDVNTADDLIAVWEMDGGAA